MSISAKAKRRIAREWLVVVGSLLLGVIITQIASYVYWDHPYLDYWSDLFTRDGDREVALQCLFGPLAITELWRSIRGSIRMLRARE